MSAPNPLEVQCDDPWFSYLQRGEKRVEGRKGKPEYRALQKDDVVRFRCTDHPENTFLARVQKVDAYASITEYLQAVGVETALPGKKTLQEGLDEYHKWSTEDAVKDLGFLAIWIEVIDPNVL